MFQSHNIFLIFLLFNIEILLCLSIGTNFQLKNNFASLFRGGSTEASSSNSYKGTLVIIDGFTEYLSGICKEYCKEHNIQLIELISPYISNLFQSQGRDVPLELRAPIDNIDIQQWASGLDFGNDKVFVISESDSGVSTAEKISKCLGLAGNGISPQLRNKFDSNEYAKANGLEIVEQKLVSSIDDALEFANKLWGDNELIRRCIIKPYRGVASDGVYLCSSDDDIRHAFSSLYGKPKYGGGVNDYVLIQEFADGDEYAVDTVAQNGEIKVVALWKYHKIAVNDAPFVYQCTELVDVSSNKEEEVCEYAIKILQAQGLKWGPTHTEIKYTSKGPRLIEINARWHAQNFPPLVQRSIGYDAVTVTLDAFFNPDKFKDIPKLPQKLIGNARILHLISMVEGKVKSLKHIHDIANLPSTVILDFEPEDNEFIVKTRDIRTDCGYVLQYHEDSNVLIEDYNYIVSLQPFLIEIWDSLEDEKKFVLQEINTVIAQQVIQNSNSRISLALKSFILRFCFIALISYASGALFSIVLPIFLKQWILNFKT